MQHAERGGQLGRATVVGSESISSKLGTPAYPRVSQWADRRAERDSCGHSPSQPVPLVRRLRHGNANAGDGNDREASSGLTTRECASRSASSRAAARHGAASHIAKSIGRVAPVA
jgi:hypothetical protein